MEGSNPGCFHTELVFCSWPSFFTLERHADLSQAINFYTFLNNNFLALSPPCNSSVPALGSTGVTNQSSLRGKWRERLERFSCDKSSIKTTEGREVEVVEEEGAAVSL